MIEAAGLGVAMGHAPEGVRAKADYVCGTAEEEGAREVIQPWHSCPEGSMGAVLVASTVHLTGTCRHPGEPEREGGSRDELP